MTTLNDIQKSIEDQLRNSEWFGLNKELDIQHAVTGLCEEAGEVAGLCKKQYFRHKDKSIDEWKSELGDVLWYLTAVAVAKDISMEDIWKYNNEKLDERRRTGMKGNNSWEG